MESIFLPRSIPVQKLYGRQLDVGAFHGRARSTIATKLPDIGSRRRIEVCSFTFRTCREHQTVVSSREYRAPAEKETKTRKIENEENFSEPDAGLCLSVMISCLLSPGQIVNKTAVPADYLNHVSHPNGCQRCGGLSRIAEETAVDQY